MLSFVEITLLALIRISVAFSGQPEEKAETDVGSVKQTNLLESFFEII